MANLQYPITPRALWVCCVLLFPLLAIAKPAPQDISKELAVLSPYNQQIQQRFNANAALVTHILERLKQHRLPESLVLVPMLESSFNPDAVSPAKASGLWQLMPATAERFGLQVSPQNDQRFDVYASTDAALAYLRFLYSKFNGDLSLTLAAYNAGEGRVSRAIKRAGQSRFTSLSLPAETLQYVSRFYALSALVEPNSLVRRPTFALSLFSTNAKHANAPLINLETLPPLIEL